MKYKVIVIIVVVFLFLTMTGLHTFAASGDRTQFTLKDSKIHIERILPAKAYLSNMKVVEYRWTVFEPELYDIMKIKVCNHGNMTLEMFAATIKFYNNKGQVVHRATGHSDEDLEAGECADIEVFAKFPDAYTDFKIVITEIKFKY